MYQWPVLGILKIIFILENICMKMFSCLAHHLKNFQSKSFAQHSLTFILLGEVGMLLSHCTVTLSSVILPNCCHFFDRGDHMPLSITATAGSGFRFLTAIKCYWGLTMISKFCLYPWPPYQNPASITLLQNLVILSTTTFCYSAIADHQNSAILCYYQ